MQISLLRLQTVQHCMHQQQWRVMMATDTRAELAKMEADEKAASDALAAMQKANADKKAAMLKELRDTDLADVKEKCLLHGFTATDLRTVLKAKGAAKKATPAKSPRKPAAKRRTTKAA
jgi:hypothetical protein